MKVLMVILLLVVEPFAGIESVFALKKKSGRKKSSSGSGLPADYFL